MGVKLIVPLQFPCLQVLFDHLDRELALMQGRLQRGSKLLPLLDQLLVAIADGSDGNDVRAHRVARFFEGPDATRKNRVIHSVDIVDALVTK